MIQAPDIQSPGRLLAGLVTRGLIPASAALDRVVSVDDRTRSNPVAMIAIDGKPLLVAKQRGIRVDHLDPLAAEAAAYSWLARTRRGGLAPRLLASADADGVLVLEAVPAALDLQQLLLRRGAEAADGFAMLGRALRRLHRASVTAAELEIRRPWILDLAARGLPTVVPDTDVVRDARDRVLGEPPLAAVLAGLGATFRPRAAVHGDVKFDNVLLAFAGDGRVARLWLIDWEMAGRGEPGWDLAGVVEGTLTAQLMTTGRVDVPAAAGPIAAAMREYGPVPGRRARRRLLAWTAARLAQATLQLAAMASVHETAEAYGADATAGASLVADAGPATGAEGSASTATAARHLAEQTGDLAASVAADPGAWAAVLGSD